MTRRTYWKKAIEPVEQAKRFVAPLVAFVGRGDESEGRPNRFKVIDADGNEREVYAPHGHITRWP